MQAAEQGGTANQVMLLSVVVTYGCECIKCGMLGNFQTDFCTVYAFGSLLAFDPWHMITSFLPYLFLSPTYINILNM
jgi:chitin synthase